MNSRDLLIICLFMGLTGCESIKNKRDYSIIPQGNFISIKAGILERELNLENNNFTLSRLLIDSENIIQGVSDELSFTLWKASPNSEPKGIEY